MKITKWQHWTSQKTEYYATSTDKDKEDERLMVAQLITYNADPSVVDEFGELDESDLTDDQIYHLKKHGWVQLS